MNIDRLVNSLEALGSGIRDASAAHIARTDMKNAIKVVTLRLGTIRTKPKPRTTIWGEETSLRLEDTEMMKKYFTKKER